MIDRIKYDLLLQYGMVKEKTFGDVKDKELLASYLMGASNEFFMVNGRKPNMLSKDDVMCLLNIVEDYKKKGK